MMTRVSVIIKPWMKICLFGLRILSNPFTHRFFRESSAYSIIVIRTIPIDYPATSEPHALEKVKASYDVVALDDIVTCGHAKFGNSYIFIRDFVEELNHVWG